MRNLLLSSSSRALLLATLALGACGDIDVFAPLPEFGGPQGIIDGTVTYVGPAPCTEGGHIVGAAVLLAFSTNLLPPPEGLGTTAVSVDAVTGDELFSGIRSSLTFNGDGSRFCPDPAGPPVTVSSDWALGPLGGGTYQVRGFYDRDGDFDPAFSLFNLPSQGDVGGGAVDNATEVLMGAAPKYREIPLGNPDGSIPDDGVRVSGISVSLGLTIPVERPIFYAKEVLDEHAGNTDPSHVVIPSDFQLAVFSTTNPASEQSFIRMKLGAGLPAEETPAAKAAPFGLPLDESVPCFTGATVNKPCIVHSIQDADGDGVSDSIPETVGSPLKVKALFPVAIFNKLLPGKLIGAQSEPVILLQGVTLLDSLVGTVGAPEDLNEPRDEVLVALRPSVLCIDPADTSKNATLLLTHEDDAEGNILVNDPETLKGALKAQFHRDIDLVVGCLPEGDYAMNLVYETGQAWTVPNEAGVCAPSEDVVGDKQCGKRPRLASQSVVVKVGPPTDPAYCAAHPTPASCLAQ